MHSPVDDLAVATRHGLCVKVTDATLGWTGQRAGEEVAVVGIAAQSIEPGTKQ